MGCCNSKENIKKPVAAAVPAGNAGSGSAQLVTSSAGVAEVQRSLPASSVVQPQVAHSRANSQSGDEADRQAKQREQELRASRLKEEAVAQEKLVETESAPRRDMEHEEADAWIVCTTAHAEHMALLRAEQDAERQRWHAAMTLRSFERNNEMARESLEEIEASARGIVATKEMQAHGKLEEHIQEVLTVQQLREKHEREKQDHPSKPGATARSRRKHAHRSNTSLLDRLLVPLEGKNMQPRDMPEIVESLGKLSVHARVQEELRLAHALSAGYRGSAAFLSSARRDPFKAVAVNDTSMEVGHEHLSQQHGRSAHRGTCDQGPYDVGTRPIRSTSVCSRCSHASSAPFVRSHSVNSAWARDTSDRWNYSDYNMAGVPRYSPRRVKPKRARTASCIGRFCDERTPGPGSHTGIVLTHY